MKISIAVATNRDTFWRRFCESLAANDAEVEVIFVGPVGSGMADLPVPARFVDVPDPTVGAARCWEIGARLATGDLLGLPPDDVVYTPGFLDALVAEASKPHGPLDMFTARYLHNGADAFVAQRMWSAPVLPLLPVGGFSFTAAHRRIGGIDRRFHGVFWDSDLYMHQCAMGGETTLIEGHTCNEHHLARGLYVDHSDADGAVLRGLWPHPVHAGMQRASPRLAWVDYAS